MRVAVSWTIEHHRTDAMRQYRFATISRIQPTASQMTNPFCVDTCRIFTKGWGANAASSALYAAHLWFVRGGAEGVVKKRRHSGFCVQFKRQHQLLRPESMAWNCPLRRIQPSG